jgi:biopolymer transport protein ExbD
MSTTFSCPNCNKQLKAKPEHAGRRVKCSRCGEPLLVPRAPALASGPFGTGAAYVPGSAAAAAGGAWGPSGVEEKEEAPIAAKMTPPDNEIDMTPMVDVVFQLLIFFMITAAFAGQKAMQAPAPDPTETASQSRTIEEIEEDETFLVVRIEKDSSIWVEDVEAFDENDLIAKLRRRREGKDPPSRLLVYAHPDAKYEATILVLDSGQFTGFDDVRFAPAEDE